MIRWLWVVLLFLPGSGWAADRHAELISFNIQPANLSYNKLAGYTWPDVELLDAVVRVQLEGIRTEEKVTVFLVLLDEEEEVYLKEKGKHWLPTGEHDIVFPEIIRTDRVLGERSFVAQVEVSMSGSLVLRDELEFTVTGPDPPEVDIIEISLLDPEHGSGYLRFGPGDEVVLDALIEIEDNETDISPAILLYAAMEDDLFDVNPDLSYQPYSQPWESRSFEVDEGVYRLTARAHLPYYFSEPYQTYHEFRIWVIVDFGPGAVTRDYVLDELYDSHTGDFRESDDPYDRLIEVAPGYTWTFKRVRGDAPQHDRWWN